MVVQASAKDILGVDDEERGWKGYEEIQFGAEFDGGLWSRREMEGGGRSARSRRFGATWVAMLGDWAGLGKHGKKAL